MASAISSMLSVTHQSGRNGCPALCRAFIKSPRLRESSAPNVTLLTCRVRRDLWCHSGVTVTRTINHFLLESRTCFTWGEFMFTCEIHVYVTMFTCTVSLVKRPWLGRSQALGKKLLPFCLLDIAIQTDGLGPLSTAAREAFFLHQAAVNIQTYLAKVLGGTAECSALHGTPAPPPRLRIHHEREGGKTERAR